MTQKKLNPVKNKMFGNVEIKRKTRTNSSIKKEIFISIINNLGEVLDRQEKLFSELRLDYSTYNELYYKIIEDLMLLHFGDQGMDLIDFYLYGRLNPDGTENQLMDGDGVIVPCNTPEDLWSLINQQNAIS
jgi:hypothetical protein